MYHICRLILILSVLATLYSTAMFAMQFGGLVFFGIGIALIAAIAKGGYHVLTAFGTGRWANADDLQKAGMLGAKTGLIIGRVMDDGKSSLPKSPQGLFNPRVSSKEACEAFLKAIQFGAGRRPTRHW